MNSIQLLSYKNDTNNSILDKNIIDNILELFKKSTKLNVSK